MILWASKEQKKLLEFYEKVTKVGMHTNFIRASGLAQDLPRGLC